MKEDIKKRMNASPKKILIIDDDDRNIFALSAVLRSRKFECVSATSAMEGFEVLKHTGNIQMAMIDMMMPGIDGYELMRIIRNEPGIQQIPIIAITAQAMTGDKEKCLAAGADAYISKPVDIMRLVTMIDDLFSSNVSSV